jgi:two-component system phosphate regulon sensor histidine kinase PhoR
LSSRAKLQRSLQVRLAWRQSLLRFALLYALAILVAAWTGEWAWTLLAATAMVAVRAYWRLFRILRFLDWRQQLGSVHGQGLWAALDTLVYRRQTETRARARRLVGLLRSYRQAATAMPDGALIVDRRDQRMIWFNKSARRLLGLRYPQSLEMPLSSVLGDAAVQRWLAAGNTEDALNDVESPVDPARRLGLQLIRYSSREWLLVVRDVTQLVQLEQVRRDFVANVSHELRTPLTVIHGYLDMMEPGDDPEWAPMVAEMRRQSQRMTELLADLLTLSRLEGHDALVDEPVAMSPMLDTLRREAEALGQGRHAVLVTDTARCDLIGSTRELHSAFSNLVANAVRYTPSGGSIGIEFSPADDGGAILAVVDTGFGIPAVHVPRLTERFYRVSTSRSRESGGTGLGLAIVKHVLVLHQARLQIDSEVGRGSRFACVFGPARVRARVQPPAAPHSSGT